MTDITTRAGWRMEGGTMRRKSHAMCRSYRRSSADLSSSVRWFSGSVKGDRTQIQRNRTTKSNQLVGSI